MLFPPQCLCERIVSKGGRFGVGRCNCKHWKQQLEVAGNKSSGVELSLEQFQYGFSWFQQKLKL
jgi:hypothetical protein